jgi:hypothetical protein
MDAKKAEPLQEASCSRSVGPSADFSPSLTFNNVKTLCTLSSGTHRNPAHWMSMQPWQEYRGQDIKGCNWRHKAKKTATHGPRNHKTLLTKILKSRLLIVTNALKGHDMQIFHVFSVMGCYLPQVKARCFDNRNALRIWGKKRSFGRQELEKKREGFVLHSYPQSKQHLCKTDGQILFTSRTAIRLTKLPVTLVTQPT